MKSTTKSQKNLRNQLIVCFVVLAVILLFSACILTHRSTSSSAYPFRGEDIREYGSYNIDTDTVTLDKLSDTNLDSIRAEWAKWNYLPDSKLYIFKGADGTVAHYNPVEYRVHYIAPDGSFERVVSGIYLDVPEEFNEDILSICSCGEQNGEYSGCTFVQTPDRVFAFMRGECHGEWGLSAKSVKYIHIYGLDFSPDGDGRWVCDALVIADGALVSLYTDGDPEVHIASNVVDFKYVNVDKRTIHYAVMDDGSEIELDEYLNPIQ